MDRLAAMAPAPPPPLNPRVVLVFPILLITIGIGWLLSVRGVLPGVDWVWIMLLGVTGALVLLLGGMKRTSLFVGLFLIVCSGAALMRQTGRLDINTEVPGLTIAAGVLLLLVRLAPAGPRASS